MGRNKDELIKLAEKITGQECKDVLTKKDALKKIACHYLGEEKEFASIADCLECIVEYGATGGGSGGGGMPEDYWKQERAYIGRGYMCMFASGKVMSTISSEEGGISETIDDYVYLTSTDFGLYTDVIVTFADGTTKAVTFE